MTRCCGVWFPRSIASTAGGAIGRVLYRSIVTNMFYVLIFVSGLIALDEPLAGFGMFVTGCLFIVRTEALKVRRLELEVRELELKVKD